MTLIESMMSPCVRMIRDAVQDDYFGHNVAWREGEIFPAAVIKNKQPEITEAEQPDAAEEYTVITYTTTALSYDDMFRRLSDGAVFHVIGYSRDTEAPAMCTVQIWKAPAERSELIV